MALRLLSLILPLVLLSPPVVAKVRFLELYTGLPNYEQTRPFAGKDKKAHAALSDLLGKARASGRSCPAGRANGPDDWSLDLQTNVCERDLFDEFRRVVTGLAPALNPNKLTVWLVDLDHDRTPEVLVGYVDFSSEKLARYPYLSLWWLKPAGQLHTAVYAGPFLHGDLQAVVPFGPTQNLDVVFVSHQSCLECEPVVFLTPIDFTARGDAKPYEFTYSEDHKKFSPTIEYELPGMGHTVDANVETRVPPVTPQGPHLLQLFNMEKGDDEWWEFTCADYRCDYKMYLKQPPPPFLKLWSMASKL